MQNSECKIIFLSLHSQLRRWSRRKKIRVVRGVRVVRGALKVFNSYLITPNYYSQLSNYFPIRKNVESNFKEIVATLSNKNEMGAYTRYVTISFFEDKEANAP